MWCACWWSRATYMWFSLSCDTPPFCMSHSHRCVRNMDMRPIPAELDTRSISLSGWIILRAPQTKISCVAFTVIIWSNAICSDDITFGRAYWQCHGHIIECFYRQFVNVLGIFIHCLAFLLLFLFIVRLRWLYSRGLCAGCAFDFDCTLNGRVNCQKSSSWQIMDHGILPTTKLRQWRERHTTAEYNKKKSFDAMASCGMERNTV